LQFLQGFGNMTNVTFGDARFCWQLGEKRADSHSAGASGEHRERCGAGQPSWLYSRVTRTGYPVPPPIKLELSST
jgi:hypothetical protein